MNRYTETIVGYFPTELLDKLERVANAIDDDFKSRCPNMRDRTKEHCIYRLTALHNTIRLMNENAAY